MQNYIINHKSWLKRLTHLPITNLVLSDACFPVAGKRREHKTNKSDPVRHKFPDTKTKLATDCAWERGYLQFRGAKWIMYPSLHRAFLQLSMMINKLPFVQEAAASIAQDHMEHALYMCEKSNGGLFFSRSCVRGVFLAPYRQKHEKADTIKGLSVWCCIWRVRSKGPGAAMMRRSVGEDDGS